MSSLRARSDLKRGLRWPLILAAAALPSAAFAASGYPDSLITASRGIGPFHLGMTPVEIQALRRSAPCEVNVIYSGGRAARLETNCGGAYRTAEQVQVGIGPGRMVWYYGRPDRVSASDFADVRGEWMHYNAGIAFRVVYGDGPQHALIQAIAVYRGTGRLIVRQQQAPPTVTPPPGVGE